MSEQATIGVLDQFQSDLAGFWSRLPNKSFFFILLAAWLAIFQFFGNPTLGYVHSSSLFRWMFAAYTAQEADGTEVDDNLGLWVPLIVLGLLWWKRKELIELRIRAWSPAIFMVAGGMLVHIAGYIVQQPRICIVGMLLGIYGLIGLAWGPEWLKACFFPFFLLAFCVPFSAVLEPVTFPLRLLASAIVEGIAHNVLGIDVIRQGTKLMDPAGKYQYEVAAACSGIRSLVAIGLIAVIGAFVYFKSWWRRVALMASAVPLAVIGNVVRLLTVIISAEIGGQKVGDYVHHGGPGGIISLLPYLPAFFGLMALGRWLKEPQT